MDFLEKLKAKAAEGRYVCLGLDPVYEKIPDCVPGRHDPDASDLEKAIVFYSFCVMVVDATKDEVAAYKPNCAFFEALDWPGTMMLGRLIAYIRRVAPDVVIDLDAKRADIGKTNDGYATMAFDAMDADAITVNPYFGEEALRPFLDREGKGVIVLCRTSNEGAKEFQDRMVQLNPGEAEEYGLDPKTTHIPLYQLVACRVKRWTSNGHIAVVVGATYPEELGVVRDILPATVILIPGVGAQGGSLEQAVRQATKIAEAIFQLNAGSKVLFASSDPDFAEKARDGVVDMNQQIGTILEAAA